MPGYSFVGSTIQPPPSFPTGVAFDAIQFHHLLAMAEGFSTPPPDGTTVSGQYVMGLFDDLGAEVVRWTLDYDLVIDYPGILPGPLYVTQTTTNSQAINPLLPIVPPGDILAGFNVVEGENFGIGLNIIYLNVYSDAISITGASGYEIREISKTITSPFFDILDTSIGCSLWVEVAGGDGMASLTYNPHSGQLAYSYIDGGNARIARNREIASFSTVGDTSIATATSIYSFVVDGTPYSLYGASGNLYVNPSSDEGSTWPMATVVGSSLTLIGAKYSPQSGCLVVIAKDGSGVAKRVLVHFEGGGSITPEAAVNAGGLPSNLSGGAIERADERLILTARSGTDITTYTSTDEGLNWT